MIFRNKNINIPTKVFVSYEKEVGTPVADENIAISNIWLNVFNKYDKSNIRDTKSLEKEDIKKLYEDFFVNGLSDGACAGKALSNPITRYKYIKRENKRIISLYLHMFPGKSKTYSRFELKQKLKKREYKEILGLLKNIQLSELVYSGQPWMSRFEGMEYLIELTDHLYFFNIIRNFFSKNDLKPIFIGDGSGILSNLVLSSDLKIGDTIFIDLPHFLLRQYIVNYDKKDKITKFIHAQDFESNLIEKSGLTIINQDSFPEIPEASLNKYFELIESNKVSNVISYNHLDLRGDHTNYRDKLLNLMGNPQIRFESKLRDGYFIEIFTK